MDYDNYDWADCTFPYDYCKPLYEFLKGKSFKTGLEIGFDSGSSALVFLAAQPEANLISVDARPLSDLTVGIDLLRKHGFIDAEKGGFSFIQNDSHREMADLIERGVKFDYIYIDGDHLYDGAKQDIMDAIKLLAPDGIIICDDADPAHKEFGVGRAIQDIAKENSHVHVQTMAGHINKAAIITLA